MQGKVLHRSRSESDWHRPHQNRSPARGIAVLMGTRSNAEVFFVMVVL